MQKALWLEIGPEDNIRVFALELAERGANLALFDLNEADLEETAQRCAAKSVKARCYRVNVADEAEVSAAMSRVISELGRLDGLVNNAGIVRDGLLVKVKNGAVVGEMSLDQWNAVIGVNLTGVFLCGREAAKHMIELGNGGVILNISSISRVGNAGQSNYSAAKAGVESMAVVWAEELARYGIRAASVAPGFTRPGILSPCVLRCSTSSPRRYRWSARDSPRKLRTPCASSSRTNSSPVAASTWMGARVSSSPRLARAPNPVRSVVPSRPPASQRK
jgi:3-oxoacyl-[acyl-carrier protein] reductase